MDSDQFSCGKDDADTFLKVLRQITRVTESVAGGVAIQYPNVMSLVAAFNREGPLILEDLVVRAFLPSAAWKSDIA